MKQKKFHTKFLGQSIPVSYIKETDTAQDAINRLMEFNSLLAIDTETMALPQYHDVAKAALSPHLSKIRLIQIFDGRRAYVFDMLHLPPKMFWKLLETKQFIAHYAVFDLMFFRQMGVGSLSRKDMNIGCTLLLFRLINHATSHLDIPGDLESVCEGLLDTDLLKNNQKSDWSLPNLNFEQIEYAAIDAVAVLKIAELLAPRLERLDMVDYYQLIKRCQHPVADMQLNGVRLHVEKHLEQAAQWRIELNKLRKEVIRLTGLPEITDHKVASWLEEHLKAELLAYWPRTPKGKLKTDAYTFSEFGHLSKITVPFMRFKKLEQLTTSFGTTLINQVNPATGKIHPSYRLLGARTGRFSCSSPNLQQSPRAKEFRDNIIADDGHIFVDGDYKTVEVRAFAEVSNDSKMLEGFKRGLDIYRYTGAGMLGKKIEDITDAERQNMKCLVLGLQFGLGANKLGAYARKNYPTIKMDDDKAHAQVRAYRELYAEAREWQMEEVQLAAENGYTSRTLSGKLRKYDPEHAYGNVLNHIIQGSCAEAAMEALIEAHRILPSSTKLISTIHDETMLMCLDTKPVREYTQRLLNNIMVKAYSKIFTSGRTVKNLVDIHCGKSWAAVKGM